MTQETLKSRILDAFKVMGSMTSTEAQQLFTDEIPKSIQSQISQASLAGELLREVAPRKQGDRGIKYIYSFNPDFVRGAHKKRVKASRGPNKVTDSGMAARLDIANKLVTELQAWKVDAIARYPDLAVDPTIIEARKLVARVMRDAGDRSGAEDVMSGRRDKSVAVLAVAEAVARI